jgi:mannan endo-1,4-beta-mannosidase
MHQDCTSGSQRDDTWFSTGYQSPYGSYALSYREYVAGLVEHFRDEPTIMGWELMHQASAGQFTVLDEFASDMATLVRAIDPNHLISLGAIDGNSSATSTSGETSNFQRLNGHTEIDMIDVHDFDAPNEIMPAHVQRARDIAHALAKPIFEGALGVKVVDASPSALSTRAEQVRLKLQAAQNDGFVGLLVYDFLPGWSDEFYDFDARPEEPLAGAGGVIDRAAPRY